MQSREIVTVTLANGVRVLAKSADHPFHFSGYGRADYRAAVLRAAGLNATAYESAYRRNLWYVAIDVSSYYSRGICIY